MPNGFGFNPMFAGSYGCAPCGCGCGPTAGAGFQYGMPQQASPWYPGPTTWGGTFSGMYPGQGWAYSGNMPSDEDIEEMIYNSIDADPVIPYDCEIDIEVTGGVVTLSGTVPNKRVKHAVGDDAWWVPGVWDVNNVLEVSGRGEKTTARTSRSTASTGTTTGRSTKKSK